MNNTPVSERLLLLVMVLVVRGEEKSVNNGTTALTKVPYLYQRISI